VLLALNPALTNNEVSTLLEHSADDVNPATGCPQCKIGRDSLSGWGRLDVARAVQTLAGPLPIADRYEPNDDAGAQAHAIAASQQTVAATADYYDDPVDVYRISLRQHQRLTVKLSASWAGANVKLELWRPGTRTVFGQKAAPFRAAQSVRRGAQQQLVFRAPAAGSYYVEVKVASAGFGPYTLTLKR
jgi:Bacterial pre-peptidase C-terminal domain